MDDSLRKPRWWLIVTAAILALLTLFYYTGSWFVVMMFFAAFGMLVAYQTTRARKRAFYICVRCGEKLNSNARECSSCGSVNRTITN